MSRKAYVNKEFTTVKELQNKIKSLEQDVKILNKLYFILNIYQGNSVKYTANKLGITNITGQKWLKQWNESGFEGLKRKSGSGGKSRLSNEDKEKLNKIILEKELKTAKQVRKVIIDEFNVEYSIRQVERILKSLGFTYSKPYNIYEKMPENAEEILKKTKRFQFKKGDNWLFRSNSMPKFK